MVDEYVAVGLAVLALISVLACRRLMRKTQRYKEISPLIELMDAKLRKRHRYLAMARGGSVFLLLIAWIVASPDEPSILTVVSATLLAYMMCWGTYRHYTGFMGMHAAFDDTTDVPVRAEHLARAVELYYARGTGKLVFSLSREGQGGLVLTHASRAYTFPARPGLDPWAAALAVVLVAPSINLHGLLLEHVGGGPVTEILTDPLHPEIP